jgi:hypothetical protein
MVGTVRAVLVVSVDDCFSVAVCIEGVTEFLELVAELAIVVNLPVENYPGSSILIVNGLLPTLQIDYRQAAHAKADGTVKVKAIVVWTAMPDGSAHASYQRPVDV